jgi:hypothetical protein
VTEINYCNNMNWMIILYELPFSMKKSSFWKPDLLKLPKTLFYMMIIK